MLLRSFGHDGGIQVTRGGGSKSPAPAFTIEDLIGEAALAAGYSGGVQALHDHDCNEIPVGPTYVKVEVSRWESIVRSALAGAPVIALLATPGRRLGPSSTTSWR